MADLACGHRQHVRHVPPWSERPWVMTAEGRAGRIGTPIDCQACDAPGSIVRRWQPGVWLTPSIVTWSRLLLDSFRHWTGRELLAREGTPAEQSGSLFFAPFVVVSHGQQADPILNYGNQAALELWETDWATFVKTPSRVTAEPANQAERERMLARAAERGVIEDYRSIRISLTGRRFAVEDALVWNVIGPGGQRHGQAATFSRSTNL